MPHQFLVNFSTGALCFLVMVILTSCPANGAMRGPHHPRNSAKVKISSGQAHGHNHYVPPTGHVGEPAPILTHDKNILHDQEHIKEDLGEWVTADGKNMTPEEMEFHYFKMHDFDQNSLLDGLEILQAISHIMPEDADLTGHGEVPPSGENAKKALSKEDIQKQKDDDLNYYVELIDRVLEEDDLNKDGYLSYFEYATGRRRDDTREKALRSSIPNPSL